MKAEDLMIGDWVLVKELDFSNLTNVISEYQHQIRLKDFAEMYNAGEYKKYEPIPLTTEILEKNGFYNSVLIDDYKIADGVHYNIDSKQILFGFEYGTVLEIDCCYVHELQHALKLCKIKKEIVL
jgi:hypothetical protein